MIPNATILDGNSRRYENRIVATITDQPRIVAELQASTRLPNADEPRTERTAKADGLVSCGWLLCRLIALVADDLLGIIHGRVCRVTIHQFRHDGWKATSTVVKQDQLFELQADWGETASLRCHSWDWRSKQTDSNTMNFSLPWTIAFLLARWCEQDNERGIQADLLKDGSVFEEPDMHLGQGISKCHSDDLLLGTW
jgi:hypothetical protein